ncbi:ferredoxin [Solemya pervernicosa gill symbiont]|uniref:Ferredoxin n=2 Tax=Gammaproteobacteria incertae sedis TaxID=118884 RepID=A0A1T2L0I3_9GAMM|nr:4Fe-4S dicluster domain-containing protein [Candidatus Reidiella endopervernicosa]OOZ38581.1 ferredoxin [Solemya pervernicosa gill symbiont]QKQ26945.1 (2Fe-2S)-binding protein [Candidatus Reidiella endopervernicosa]
MSNTSEELVQLTINGNEITAPSSLSVIQALWHAGYPRVKSVGCLEGVCGSCRVLVRREDDADVSMELGCQTLVENGMQVIFLVFPTPTHHTYQLDEIKNSWDVQAQFHRIFPEAQDCRHCGGCVKTCPKGIDVEHGVRLANKGRFKEAGDLFIECIMCNLCMTACPELISPNHVGLFSRRVTAYFHIRPSNLINRLEALRTDQLQIIK